MSKKRYIHWRMWIVATIVTILIIISLNWLLRLPAIIPIIGDENTWLPIVINGIIAVVIAIIGVRNQNKFASDLKEQELKREREKEKLQNELINRKKCFDDLQVIVNENLSVLNIEPKLLSLLSEYNPTEADYSHASRFSQYKTEIESQASKIEKWSRNYNVDSLRFAKTYINGVKTCVASFTKALEGAIPYCNKRNSVFTQMANADAIFPIVKDLDKAKISIMKVGANNAFQREKERLLKVHEGQKNNMQKLYCALTTTSELVLDELRREIEYREKRINSI